MLFFLGLFHALSDLAAGCLVARLAFTSPATATWLALWYNGLAFALQPLAGWAIDNLGPSNTRRLKTCSVLGLLCSTLALPATGLHTGVGLGLAGLGSALMHAAGGSLAIQATSGRASGPGLFAAPGVIGLALGGLLAISTVDPTWPLGGVALLATAGLWRSPVYSAPPQAARAPVPAGLEWAVVFATAALALRSAAWNGLQVSYGALPQAFLGLALAAAVGKAVGGLLADRLGWSGWGIGSTLAAAPLLALAAAGWSTPLVLWSAALLLQSAIPLHLAALGRLLPGRPALAAGLGLGLSVALGGLPLLAGLAPRLNRPLPLLLLACLALLPLLPILRLRLFRSPML